MFYKLIEKKRNEWLVSEECTIKDLLKYIEQRGMMRDAQIEAIKTYLFLKVACKNQPLWKLFVSGVFNDTNIGQVELTETARQIFSTNKAAVALFQYSRLIDKKGRQLAPVLEKYIKQHADKIDYEATFKKIFYDVSYTDYLFSLPMGAGKTYLMAAFIYLDLYFAQNEPDNPCFAHNFMVMAPSGLKSSIVPSLKHIKEFDPSWIIPEPTATQLRRLIKFEILDEQKTANKSNRIKNPNAQKINNHQPLEDLMGLVAITNAEKVILDRFDKDADPSLFSDEERKRMELANELREIIGNLPNLAIYIDEVHHAADGEIKLRQVVNKWTEKNTFNSVLGFSGTPYLESAEPINLSEGFSIKNTDLANVVYYYPLIEGIGNFLKIPDVKFTDNDTETIVTNGVKEFLDMYLDKEYANGTCAKLAIYCGQIETLEETVYPLVAEIVASYGLNPTDVVLKYHGGNKQYPQPVGSETEFASLDTTLSKKKIVLLVQIGKEGWDCKSLTGVVLPQKGVCPTNMVLQTSCRCLRQVIKNSRETAIIWLNKFNADKLNRQLEQQQNITLKEFSQKAPNETKWIDRFSRMERMQVPPIDFYQLKVNYQELVVDEANNPAGRLQDESLLAKASISLVHQQDLEGKLLSVYEQESKEETRTSFRWWLQQIAKESFGTLSVSHLKTVEKELKTVFEQITIDKDGVTIENKKYDHQRIRSLIRQAFTPIRDIKVTDEVVPEQARLLQIEKLASPVENSEKYYPSQQAVHEVMDWDERPPHPELSAEVKAKLEELKALGVDISNLVPQADPHPERTQTYHYLPYRFDSRLERDFLSEEIIPLITGKPLEVYFNGDDTLTEFKINCYTKVGCNWRYIGRYVPDFLLLSRNEEKQIDKVIIIETKGEGFAAKFKERKDFMESEWVKKNNEKFGYQRFDFLYLEDTLTAEQRREKTLEAIKDFFKV
ncbi:MAG: DEAD/DEAH box helicase family protein [Prevotella sp.]|nr:DEAD/DEAH box helicase family protein [Prevotella sp.]